MNDVLLRATSLVGIAVLLALAWLCSLDRRRMPWRVIAVSLGLQFTIALLLLETTPGRLFFAAANRAVAKFLEFSDVGARFVFGALLDTGFSFALSVLPILIFMGSLVSVLYHLGITQWLVRGLAFGLRRLLGTSGAESLAAVANIFIGMTEAPLLVRPYIERMTRSELFTLMVTGMATIAGTVLVAYAKILGERDFAGHLLAASLMSAPAAIAVAKIMLPETEEPETARAGGALVARESVNVIDAACQGALTALRMAANIVALLIAFIALIAVLNALLAWLGASVGIPELSFERILGWLFAPLAWLMGVPWADAHTVGALLGVKTVLNEFLAYEGLGRAIAEGRIGARSAVIASYALCGFANFSSIAIMLGGLGGMAPTRRAEIAALGLRSVLAGTLATMITGCVVGVLL